MSAAPSPPWSVLLIDDHPLFRKGVAQLLAMDEDFDLCGEAANGECGVAQSVNLAPDLVLLDINMAELSGVMTLRRMREAGVRSVVVMLTVNDAKDDLIESLRVGADGYLLKDMEPEDILGQLRRAMNGEVVVDPGLSDVFAGMLREEHAATSLESAGLTRRELDTLRVVAGGASNKQVARRLDISESTVKVHMKNILRKLKLRNRLEAAIWALNHGID